MKLTLGINNTKVEVSFGLNASVSNGSKTINASDGISGLAEKAQTGTTSGINAVGNFGKGLLGGLRKAIVDVDDRVNGR